MSCTKAIGINTFYDEYKSYKYIYNIFYTKFNWYKYNAQCTRSYNNWYKCTYVRYFLLVGGEPKASGGWPQDDNIIFDTRTMEITFFGNYPTAIRGSDAVIVYVEDIYIVIMLHH